MEYVGHEFMRVFEEELIFGIKELHGQMQQPGGTVLYYLLKLSYSMGNLFMYYVCKHNLDLGDWGLENILCCSGLGIH